MFNHHDLGLMVEEHLELGYSVALGDFNDDGFDDIAAGAPGVGNTNLAQGDVVEAGHVLVLFSYVNGGITGDDVLRLNAGPQRASRGGRAVAVGDVNGDGHDDLITGAPYANVNLAFGAGEVTVCEGVWFSDPAGPLHSCWHIDETALGGTPGEADRLGSSLTTADFNGDGFDDMVIGIPADTVGAVPRAGSLGLIPGTADTPSQGEKWSQSTPGIAGVVEDGDAFGACLGASFYDPPVWGP